MRPELKEFPVTRYQGSKRKIVLWLYDILKVNNIRFNTALDVFGGTGTVSYLFKKMNKEVTFNDKLRFNSIIGTALIENTNQRLDEEEVEQVLNHVSNNSFIADNFQDVYFLDEENVWLDNVISAIEHTLENDLKKAVAYYALFQACIIKRPFNLFHRKNLYIRTNNVDRNFGNKTTWEKPFPDLFKKFVVEANNLIYDNGRICRSLNESAFEIDPTDYDLVYLDPPYFAQKGNHETANYLKCYHFLEGIANYDQWNELIDFNTPNLRFTGSNFQNDFLEDNIYDKFEELISRFSHSKIIFSYKIGGLPSIDFIIKTMKKYKRKVHTYSIHYKYALNHQNGDAQKNREVIIIGL